ncbi:DUF6036 family nucleotidyltransferase [Massilia timonae]|uniref:DUF6036 family nucleotidyltransferase n=1 Tax=Massilia timonae TaxID=47229 RepID=UPI0028D37983|nr:DUF6036 family nucleotidyltransferase [Massilia timonae]
MVKPTELAIHTDLANGLRSLIIELEQRTNPREPLAMFIAGGMAVHLYTAARTTVDVDVEFSKRILLPADLVVETRDGNLLYFDATHNSAFALLHEDYRRDAALVPIGTDMISAYVLSPRDLIVSKIARLSDLDKEDVRMMMHRFHIPAAEIERRATEALERYLGSTDNLRRHLDEVLAMPG